MKANKDLATNIFSPETGSFKSEPESELKNKVFVKSPRPVNSWISWTISIKNIKNSLPRLERKQMLIMFLNINMISAATMPTPIKIAITSKILT